MDVFSSPRLSCMNGMVGSLWLYPGYNIIVQIWQHSTNAGGSPIICVVGVGYRSLDVFSHLPIVLHEWNGCIFVVVSILDIYRKLYGLCGFQIWQNGLCPATTGGSPIISVVGVG